ncbi:MAG: polysulfide reductase NrfD [Myxococcales bacterium]|nr:polysulfide reductase NrfD [Myxococcales bacterium]
METTTSGHNQAGYVPPPDVIDRSETYGSVTNLIGSIPLEPRIRPGWITGFLVGFALLQVMLLSVTYLLVHGTGVWGLNIPVGWGFAIVNFVWWVGIGHAGTLISAILLLLKQDWRMAIARFSEAMTLFAVACAGVFPVLHTGRPWLAFWLLPYPNSMQIWPQFRSPLLWDVFAISTYATVSILFWYVGLIPDLATMRDRAKNKLIKYIYGTLALGWRGSAWHWHRYEIASLTLAGLATPLVVSVHTIVSFDFAVSVIPGWHTTIFPPYFVAGAVYSGFAMVLTLLIPLRSYYGLQSVVTMRHIHNCAKVMLATGLIVGYGYSMEIFIAWYSGVEYEQFMLITERMTGPYALQYWALIFCNVITPQFLWFRGVRENLVLLWILTIVVNIGMWLERYVIVVISLHRDYLPSSWDMYSGTVWDWGLYIGTLGLFTTLIFLFIRVLPMIAIFEVRMLLPDAQKSEEKKA